MAASDLQVGVPSSVVCPAGSARAIAPKQILIGCCSAQTGGGGGEQRRRQRVSPSRYEATPPSPDPQYGDVVLSPVFSQEELDMLLEALSQPASGDCRP